MGAIENQRFLKNLRCQPSPQRRGRVDFVAPRDALVTPCCPSAARAMRASTHSLKADSIEASWGRIMGRPAKFRFFTCPSCAALYQVVMAEAGPETKAAELACLICGAPLSPAMESSS
jgi:hypothetical protein